MARRVTLRLLTSSYVSSDSTLRHRGAQQCWHAYLPLFCRTHHPLQRVAHQKVSRIARDAGQVVEKFIAYLINLQRHTLSYSPSVGQVWQ
jgi:hypothetical protein